MDNLVNNIKGDRYPGLWPFRQDQYDIFFGREQEKRELFQQVRREQAIVLFAKSGIGKSSLLNAGITPLLLNAGFFPINIILTKTKEQGNSISSDPLTILKTALQIYSWKKESPFGDMQQRLWEYIKSSSFPNNATPVLIFDQFEDLFTYSKSQVTDFSSELSELIHELPPSRISEQLLNTDEENRSDVHFDWVTQPAVKFIFAIRSDWLAELQKMEELIPGIFNRRYQLLAMTNENAELTIKKPAENESAERFECPRFTYEKDCLKKIINNLKDEQTAEIAPAQLQIICRHIEELIKDSYRDPEKKPINEVTSEVFDADKDTDNVLRNYYEQQIRETGSPEEQLLCRTLLENDLMEGTVRVRLPEGKVMERLKNNKQLLQKLLHARLIKIETDPYGAAYYEISHDSLKDPILKSKQERGQEQIKEAERQSELAEAEQYIFNYYHNLENDELREAKGWLEKAAMIFDKHAVIKASVETRLSIAKVLLMLYNIGEAKQLLDDTLMIAKEKKDNSLIGRVNENLASLYENEGDGHEAFKYYNQALNIYREIYDRPQTARLAEHLGGFKEQLYDELIIEAKRKELKDSVMREELIESVITESYNYYNEALQEYILVSDIFGIKRVQRSLDRVKRFAKPWGYLTELLTGKIHSMKGKNAIRIGRDVYDAKENIYTLKNEIGFPREMAFVSRRHAMVTPDLVIEDTQSMNGTTINTLPLYYGNPRVLTGSDIIVLANILPLQFAVEEPANPEIPEGCWGVLITSIPKTFHYLAGDQEFSVALTQLNSETPYEIRVTQGEQKNTLVKFKLIDNVPCSFAEENLVVFNKKIGKKKVNIMCNWKIRTTVKEENRFYKDYILNTGEWFQSIESPLQPQLTAIEKGKKEEEIILLFGPTFQLIIKPEYNPQLQGYLKQGN